ncbi:hypothetical protein LZ32DRAFT_659383 [Colletotrichum eremochloae]|nr:hypothetical protein LZ32DRAFT_659383 [Colletotrichum eremochloae]
MNMNEQLAQYDATYSPSLSPTTLEILRRSLMVDQQHKIFTLFQPRKKISSCLQETGAAEDTTTTYDLPAEKAKTDEKQAYGRKHMHAIMRQLVDILDAIKSTMTKTEIKTAVEKGREIQQWEPAFGHPQSLFTSAYNDDNNDVFYSHTNSLIRDHSDSENETWMGTPL